jgi:sugar O-acyltransferase (sialic acid O-acetyltransferase NeuD family)
MMPNIVIVGASGHAKVVIDILGQAGRWKVVGLVDRSHEVGVQILGVPVLGREEDLPRLVGPHELMGAVVAIGDNSARATVVARIGSIAPRLKFVPAIHPRAVLAGDVAIGEGSVVMAGAAIGAGASVGRFCILNTNASLDHDSVLEDFASLAPGVTTGGNCRIGTGAAIGIGAVLRHGISIGEHAVIGAGSLVLKSVEAAAVAYGSPARTIRCREPGEPYL